MKSFAQQRAQLKIAQPNASLASVAAKRGLRMVKLRLLVAMFLGS